MKTRIKTLGLFLMLTGSAFAQDTLLLKAGNISLANSEGRLSSEEVEYTGGPLRFYAQPADFNFRFQEGLFHLEHQDFQVSYDFGKEGMLSGIARVESENLNLYYQKERKVEVVSQGLLLEHSKGTQYLPAFTLRCSAPAQKSLVEDVSGMCLNLGTLQIPTLEFDQLSAKAVAKALNTKGLDKIEEVKLYIVNGGVNLSFKARFLFKWTVKIEGNISYDSERGVATLKLDKAKAGIFSVKKTILKQIREANLSSVTVNGDVLTITL